MTPGKTTGAEYSSGGRLNSQKCANTAFAAMAFAAPHAQDLWEIIQFACKRHGIQAVRADDFDAPRPIITDIREEIQKAEIIIADLTDCNPNVLYELGLAHAITDAVILLCAQGQKLPFDLSGLRCIFHDLSTVSGQEALYGELSKALDTIKPSDVPTTVIRGKLERTRSLTADLRILASYPEAALSRECVWFSGFLSALATSEEEKFDPGDIERRDALLTEKRMLLELARRGCAVRCIIAPPRKDDLLEARMETASCRLRTLLALLKDTSEPALERIEVVVSPFRQKNYYVVGHICTSEGFKVGLEKGYDLTLRQTGRDAVNASIAALSTVFEELRSGTLAKFGGGQSGRESRQLLRSSVIRALEESLNNLAAESIEE